MKKYKLKQGDMDRGFFDSKAEACDYMMKFIGKDNNGDYINDCTPFDFVIEEVSEKDSNVIDTNYNIDSFDSAVEYLHDNGVLGDADDEDTIHYTIDVMKEHFVPICAISKLITIAKAWNMMDNFTADFSIHSQNKWFPCFEYSDDDGKLFCIGSNLSYTISSNANFGSLLCFKTEERARQFGTQFIDLWNDFLMAK